MSPYRIETAPLLKALPPLMAGIVTSDLSSIPAWSWLIGLIVCGTMAWFGRTHKLALLYLAGALFFFGALDATLMAPRSEIPHEETVRLEMEIGSVPVIRTSGYGATDAVIGHWKTQNGVWKESREKLLVSFDTLLPLRIGERLVCETKVRPVADSANGYARLMQRRGYTGRIFLSPQTPIVHSLGEARTIGTFARKLQHAAANRLAELSLSSDDLAVATAMALGEKRAMDSDLKEAYARAGASHLLAVSGLHVGMVFLLINGLLWLLPAARRGHIAKNILAILAIWFYTFLAGASPSVIRAACMFSALQIALATSAARNSLNILCGTAIIMLAIRPNYLYDISFQLSFLAVAAILLWFPPLYSRLECRWRVLNALWGTLLIGIVASLATAPLAAYQFGRFSLLGIVINPAVVLTAYLTVIEALLWLILPLPFLKPLFSTLIGWSVGWQNRIVTLTAALPESAIDLRLSTVAVWSIYTLYLLLTLWLLARPTRRPPISFPRA